MKFVGSIGVVQQVEVRPGFYEDRTVEYPVVGDVLTAVRRTEEGDQAASDVTYSNRISVVYTQDLISVWMIARYVVFNGVKLSISSITIEGARAVFSLGGAYNGKY